MTSATHVGSDGHTADQRPADSSQRSVVGSRAESSVPRWLRFVMASDRAGSSWYLAATLLSAPVLARLSPWPTVTTVLWWVIGVAGLCLGLLGIAMAVGLARVLRSGAEIPEEYWRSLIDGIPASTAHDRSQADPAPERVEQSPIR